MTVLVELLVERRVVEHVIVETNRPEKLESDRTQERQIGADGVERLNEVEQVGGKREVEQLQQVEKLNRVNDLPHALHRTHPTRESFTPVHAYRDMFTKNKRGRIAV